MARRYATPIDRESAHEILERKISQAAEVRDQAPAAPAPRASAPRKAPKPQKGVIEEALDSRIAQNVGRQVARTVTQQIVRGIFGLLKSR